jgi:hypothetical protein
MRFRSLEDLRGLILIGCSKLPHFHPFPLLTRFGQ